MKERTRQEQIEFELLMGDALVKKFLLDPVQKLLERSERSLRNDVTVESLFRAQGAVGALEEVVKLMKRGR
jgi:hypothetical protein